MAFIDKSKSRIGQRWTIEEVDELKRMIAEGKKPLQIAQELNRCDKGVMSKAYSLKLKFS